MNNSMIIGRYFQKDSLIHRLDPRTKLISLILLMVSLFIIPFNTTIPYVGFALMGGYVVLLLLVIMLSKIPLYQFIQSYKSIIFLMLFSFVIQMLFNKGDGTTLYIINFNFTLVNIAIIFIVFAAFILLRKFLKAKMLILLVLIIGSVFLSMYPIFDKPFLLTPSLSIYKYGLTFGAFTVLRVMIIISFSTIFTLTTKPIDISNGIEWLLKPLELIKIKTSIFAMMLSIALRFIPTLLGETEKILKAQASRGVDFKENSLAKQIIQIISLLIPMFVISIKRASDLADAMEARGYIPGAKRTKLLQMKFKTFDYLSLIFVVLTLVFAIVGRVVL